ncbi:MAG: hypothetical protein NTX50_23565 [Candidatus Sumerlaeota bacterium]|nr:hypothetical protein [Candidatus Sumerlaeota bacterium]
MLFPLGARRFGALAFAMVATILSAHISAAQTTGGKSSSASKGPLKAVITKDGAIELTLGSQQVGSLRAGLYDMTWRSTEATGSQKSSDARSNTCALKIKNPSGGDVEGDAVFTLGEGGVIHAVYNFTASQDMTLNSLNVSLTCPTPVLAGGKWKADDKSGVFPAQYKDAGLHSSAMKNLTLDLTGGEALQFTFAAPIATLLQDNRQWSESFVIRIGASKVEMKKGQAEKIAFTLAATSGLKIEVDKPVTITAGPDWVPLKLSLDIDAGSALDFSNQGMQDAPAGKNGWVVARSDGHFAFEKDPQTPRRFYGVNFCFSALYLTHEESDKLAERLARLGYNAIRVHHYEGELVKGQPNTVTLNTDSLDKLDYLLAACYKRGIYVTTDLFVSRPVKLDEAGATQDRGMKKDAMNEYKIRVPVVPKAMESYKAFTRALLTHVNPYTKRTYAQEPGLAWLALINEGNFGNFVGMMKDIPEWGAAWNQWLVKRYKDRASLAASWGKELKSEEDPAAGSVALAPDIYDSSLRIRDFIVFLADAERDFMQTMRDYLRKDIGTKALLSNMSSWTNFVPDQTARAEFDYVDDHFYVDHPQFIEKQWSLPSRCGNSSPIAGGASGGRSLAFTRLFDKPFTVTEYNYSAPGRFRGVGGILTGALGALQDWGGIWRFAYSHNRGSLFSPGALGYFDMAGDPLGQAAERAALCLFLRGDLKPAPHSVAIVITPQDMAQPPSKIPKLAANWHWAAWITRIGTRVVNDLSKPLPYDAALPIAWATKANAYMPANAVAAGLDPYKLDDATIMDLLRKRGILASDNPTSPAKRLYRSENGEVTIDAPRDIMILDTPRTAGGYAPAGETIETAAGVSVAMQDAPATVWASALDGKPIASSGRILVTHLTDLQNSEIKYSEREMKTLLSWGKLPHLVRAGKATVKVKMADPARCKVWALSTSGKRLAEIPAKSEGGALVFTADVAALAAQHGAVMCYELAP